MGTISGSEFLGEGLTESYLLVLRAGSIYCMSFGRSAYLPIPCRGQSPRFWLLSPGHSRLTSLLRNLCKLMGVPFTQKTELSWNLLQPLFYLPAHSHTHPIPPHPLLHRREQGMVKGNQRPASQLKPEPQS